MTSVLPNATALSGRPSNDGTCHGASCRPAQVLGSLALVSLIDESAVGSDDEVGYQGSKRSPPFVVDRTPDTKIAPFTPVPHGLYLKLIDGPRGAGHFEDVLLLE